jgi:hypothetical protein
MVIVLPNPAEARNVAVTASFEDSKVVHTRCKAVVLLEPVPELLRGPDISHEPNSLHPMRTEAVPQPSSLSERPLPLRGSSWCQDLAAGQTAIAAVSQKTLFGIPKMA